MDLDHLLPTLDIGTLLYYLFGLTILDFIIGVSVALSRKGTGFLGTTFSWDQVAGFLRTHVAFRVIPITVTALFADGLGTARKLDLLWPVVYASCALYLGETLASIVANLRAPSPVPDQPAQ